MKKTFDIRKIYVCKIQEVSNLFLKKIDGHEYIYHRGIKIPAEPETRRFYELNENDISYGLFIKGLTAYKHILTGSKYKLATNASVNIGEQVVNPNEIELFVKRERALASHLIEKYQSYDMDISVIKALEEEINSNAKYKNEEIFGK